MTVGGTLSEATGGKFVNGAVTGAMQYSLRSFGRRQHRNAPENSFASSGEPLSEQSARNQYGFALGVVQDAYDNGLLAKRDWHFMDKYSDSFFSPAFAPRFGDAMIGDVSACITACIDLAGRGVDVFPAAFGRGLQPLVYTILHEALHMRNDFWHK